LSGKTSVADRGKCRDKIPIMKTASVVDLRNNFASVSRWIYEGESVTIQKRGRAFAILSPAVKKKPAPAGWPDYEARLEKIFPGGLVKGRSAEQVVSELRGNW